MPANQLVRQPYDLHINSVLSTLSVAYVQSQDSFIADRVFPNIPVQKQSDIFWRYPKGTFFRTDVEPRSPGAEPPRTSWRPMKDTYVCDNYEIAQDIFDEERANADSEFELDSTAVMQLTQQHLIFREKLWAQNFWKTGVWGTDYTGVAAAPGANQFLQWDVPGSDPIEQMQLEMIKMHEATGIEPNTLVLTPYIVNTLKNHALILDRYKMTGVATALGVQGSAGLPNKVWLQILSELFDIPRILVARTVINTAHQIYDDDPSAAPTGGMGYLFGKQMLLCHAAPSPGKRVPTAGYTFSWSGYMGASGMGIRFIKDRNNIRRADTVVAEQSVSHKIVCSDLAVFFSDVIS